ncbi:MAG: NAD-dependent epimerase/dehydratase family protein, partial [Nanoarchaeota archaeon]|nr:NAD-dependent epimerase/dehydratase family protein [Nanoarchaeota archaeon]
MSDNFWHQKKVLITGGTSFVGKNLVGRLEQLGAESTAFGSREFNLTQPLQANSLMEREAGKYDFIIHMAALQHAADWSIHHTADQLNVNGLIQLNVLEAWKNFQPQAKFIGVGSSCCYPGEISVLREADVDHGPLHNSVYAYGATKRLLGVGIRAYKDQYKLRGIMPMFATLYGPYDDFNIATAHVVSALVAKFCQAKKQENPEVEVWGDGTQTRELIYVEDQINGLLMAAQYFEGDPSTYSGD